MMRAAILIVLVLLGGLAAWGQTPDAEVLTLCDALFEPPSPGRARAYQSLEKRVFSGVNKGVGAALVERILAWHNAESASPAMPGSPSLLAFVEAAVRNARQRAERAPHVEVARQLVEWLGLCGTPAEVAALTPLLNDRDLAPAALQALARTPGEEVTRAMGSALAHTKDDTRRHLVNALGMRGDTAAIPALREAATRADDPATGWAVVESLSRLGVPPVEVARLAQGVGASDAARFANANLRAALVLAAQGETEKASGLLYRFLGLYALRHQISAALLGLARLEAPELTRAALGHINTPGVRATAIRVLTGSNDPDLEHTLTRAWPVTDASMRAAILEILSARASSKTGPLVNQALGSDNVELRVTAARLSGRTPDPDDLLILAASGPPWTRALALDDYLALAEWNAETGSEEAAVRMFLTVLDGPVAATARLRALRGVEAYGGPALRDYVQALLVDPALEEAAAQTLVALTARMPDGAERTQALQQLARDTQHPDAAALAALALQSEGGEVVDIARQRGYLLTWEVLGPLPRINPDGFDDPLFPLDEGRPPATVTVEGEEYAWQTREASGIPAVVMLEPASGARAYAVAEAPVQAWLPVEIYVGCADGGRLWINGEPVWQALGTGLDPKDAEPVLHALEPGRNRLVLEIVNDQGPWGFWVRLAHRDGEGPVDPALLEMPEDGTSGVGVRPDALMPLLDTDAP